MNQKMADPVIDEIREIRHDISVQCGHDPAKLVAYFQRIQNQYTDRLITSSRLIPPVAVQSTDFVEPIELAAHP